MLQDNEHNKRVNGSGTGTGGRRDQTRLEGHRTHSCYTKQHKRTAHSSRADPRSRTFLLRHVPASLALLQSAGDAAQRLLAGFA